MTINDMHIAVNIGVQQIASHVNRGLEPEEIDFFLNNNIENFVREEYSRFELNLNNLDSLLSITKEIEKVPVGYGSRKGITYDIFELPTDFFLLVGQYASLLYGKPSGGWVFDSGSIRIGTPLGSQYQPQIKWIQNDDIENVLSNPYAQPDVDLLLCIFVDNKMRVFTGDNIAVSTLNITYIAKPVKVSLINNISCDLASTVHQKIVDKTVLDILATWNKFGEQINLQNLTTQP